MKHNRTAIYVTILMVVSTALFGCAGRSAPTRFYLLNSGDVSTPTDGFTGSGRLVTIGIGPVDMPPYLDRPQIVTRIGPNRLNISEFDNWAEPLKDTFSRLVVEDLSKLLGRKTMRVSQFRGGYDLDYQIPVEVIRMDNNEAGEAVLIVRWRVLNEKDKKVLSAHTMTYAEKCDSQAFETFAAAHSRNLGSLCRDISETILVQAETL